MAFCSGPDGAAVETKTISAVNTAGNNITINSALANTYTWNPALGQTPCIRFGKRTWAGHTYVKVAAGADGGGDVYGHIVRQTNNYQPKPSEYHPFMANTIGQYGGDQYANYDGQYMTGWESQQHDQGKDVSAVGFVQSFDRNNDGTLGLGRFWIGSMFKSEGARPVDAAHVVIGRFRRGLDTVKATLEETTWLVDPTISSGSVIKVADANQRLPLIGDPIEIGEPGSLLYTGTVDYLPSGDIQQIGVTPALPVGVIAANTRVAFSRSGAAVNLADYQRIMFGSSSITGTSRSGDATAVYPGFYGNIRGDIVMESGTDGAGRYWSVRFPKVTANSSASATPDLSRLRLRNDGVQIFGNLNANGNIAATGNLACGASAQIDLGNGVILKSTGGHFLVSINGGSSFTTLV